MERFVCYSNHGKGNAITALYYYLLKVLVPILFLLILVNLKLNKKSPKGLARGTFRSQSNIYNGASSWK